MTYKGTSGGAWLAIWLGWLLVAGAVVAAVEALAVIALAVIAVALVAGLVWLFWPADPPPLPPGTRYITRAEQREIEERNRRILEGER